MNNDIAEMQKVHQTYAKPSFSEILAAFLSRSKSKLERKYFKKISIKFFFHVSLLVHRQLLFQLCFCFFYEFKALYHFASRKAFYWNEKCYVRHLHSSIPLCSRNFQNVKLRLDFFWNSIILPPLWFYVKSNFGEFTRTIIVIFDKFRGSEFWFLVDLYKFQVTNMYTKFESSESLKLAKMSFLELLN